MSKSYRPQLKFQDLFASQLKRPCLNTGKMIQLTSRFRNMRQIINAIGIMLILLYSFRGQVGGTWLEFIRYFAILLAMITVLALANYLVLRMATYEEVLDEKVLDEAEKSSEEDKAVILAKEKEQARMMKEENDALVALYKKYEKEYQEKHRMKAVAGQTTTETSPCADQKQPPISFDDLTLVWDWRAFFPGTAEFKTNKEGVYLIMPMFYKKLMNSILLLLMMGAFFAMRYSPSIFYTVILFVLGFGFLAQQLCVRYLIKKKRMEIK